MSKKATRSAKNKPSKPPHKAKTKTSARRDTTKPQQKRRSIAKETLQTAKTRGHFPLSQFDYGMAAAIFFILLVVLVWAMVNL